MKQPTRVRKFEVVAINRIHESWGDAGDVYLMQCHAEVISPDAPGGEAFRVTIASPSAFVAELANHDEIVSGRGYIFMRDYDEPKVLAWLQRMVDNSNASNWDELTTYVERYFDWLA